MHRMHKNRSPLLPSGKGLPFRHDHPQVPAAMPPEDLLSNHGENTGAFWCMGSTRQRFYLNAEPPDTLSERKCRFGQRPKRQGY